MSVGYPQPAPLADLMADKAPVWDRLVERYGLEPIPFDRIVGNWRFADYAFRYGMDARHSIMSTIKTRQHGFQECMDTEAMFVDLLEDLQKRKVMPR